MLYVLFAIHALIISANSIQNARNPRKGFSGTVSTSIRDHPYQITIMQDGKLWCSGSILSRFQVITAAHCVKNATSPLVVYAGTSFWIKPRSLHYVETFVVSGSESNTNLAILNVHKPFTFDELRQPIKLAPTDYKIQSGSIGVIAIWGTGTGGRSTTQLESMKVPVIDSNSCDEAYKGSNIGKIVDGVFCAGIYGMTWCLGAAGSSLVVDGFQVGIMSAGFGCGLIDYPTVYIDVTVFNKWIQENMIKKKPHTKHSV